MDSNGYQMKGVMGTAKLTFGGKSWPVFYYSTQVAVNKGIPAGSIIQQWIQFLNWDMQATDNKSYMNLVAITTFTATGGSSTYPNSCGKQDLLTGASTAANNKGSTACPAVGGFTASAPFEVIGVATDTTNGGWTSVQEGAMRNFVELPTGTTQILPLKYGDQITFTAGFKYYVNAAATTATVWSSSSPLASATSTQMTWTLVDSAVMLTTSFAATAVYTMLF